ncbi:competence protein CoiA family protein [Endozoicomonas numazuensis]
MSIISDCTICNNCKRPLILRVGKKNMPHYAHRKNEACGKIEPVVRED